MIVKFKSFISKAGMKTTENNNVRLKKTIYDQELLRLQDLSRQIRLPRV